MIEISGDLWEPHDRGNWVAITTNPIINAKGNLVMGRGVPPPPLRDRVLFRRRADQASQALQHLRGFSLTVVRSLFR